MGADALESSPRNQLARPNLLFKTNKMRKARRIARRTARAAVMAAVDADRNRLREPADTLSPFGYVKEEEDE